MTAASSSAEGQAFSRVEFHLRGLGTPLLIMAPLSTLWIYPTSAQAHEFLQTQHNLELLQLPTDRQTEPRLICLIKTSRFPAYGEVTLPPTLNFPEVID